MFNIICDDVVINYDNVIRLSETDRGNLYVDFGDYFTIICNAPKALAKIATALANGDKYIVLDGAVTRNDLIEEQVES